MKTKEQIAREYALKNCGIETYDYLFNAVLVGIQLAQQWISIEDELPKENGKYLVKCSDGDIYLTNFYTNGNFFHLRMDFKFWRPIERK